MRVRRFKRKMDALDAMQKRMIAETELALLIGLRFPDRMPRIPTIEVGVGRFHPEFAAQFWSEALDIDMDELAALNETHNFQQLML